MLNLFDISISKLQSTLEEIDSAYLIEYIKKLDKEDKEKLLKKINTILGDNYMQILKDALDA